MLTLARRAPRQLQSAREVICAISAVVGAPMTLDFASAFDSASRAPPAGFQRARSFII